MTLFAATPEKLQEPDELSRREMGLAQDASQGPAVELAVQWNRYRGTTWAVKTYVAALGSDGTLADFSQGPNGLRSRANRERRHYAGTSTCATRYSDRKSTR